MVPKEGIGDAMHCLWFLESRPSDIESIDLIIESLIDDGFKHYLLAHLADSDEGYEFHLRLSSDKGYPIANFRVGSLMEINGGSASTQSKELILSAAQQGHIKSRFWVAQDLLTSDQKSKVELGRSWISQCRKLGLSEALESENTKDQVVFFE